VLAGGINAREGPMKEKGPGITALPPFRLGLLVRPGYLIPRLRGIRSAGELGRRVLDLFRYLEVLRVNFSKRVTPLLGRVVHALPDRRYDAALAAAWSGFGPRRALRAVDNPPSPVDRNPPVKLHLSWDIHLACNYDCGYCWFHGHWKDLGRDNLYAPAPEWARQWERFNARYGPAKVDIAGGEPFTYPAFPEILASVPRNNLASVSTNLSWEPERVIGLVDPAKAEFSASFHPDFVAPEVFIDKVIKLRRGGFHASASVVAYPPFLARLPDWLDAFVSRGIHLTVHPFRGEWNGREYPYSYTPSARGLLDWLIRGEYLTRYPPETVNALQRNCASSGLTDNSLILEYQLGRRSPRGELCNTGVLYGRLRADGEVTRCAQGGCLGSFPREDFLMGAEPLPCPFHHCDCPNEMIYMRGAAPGPAPRSGLDK